MQLETGRLLQRLKSLFRENFEKRGELGAAVSVWQNGKPLIDLYGGFCDADREKPWTPDTVVVWDNRFTMHYAVRDYTEPRRMIRTSTKGERPIGPKEYEALHEKVAA